MVLIIANVLNIRTLSTHLLLVIVNLCSIIIHNYYIWGMTIIENKKVAIQPRICASSIVFR